MKMTLSTISKATIALGIVYVAFATTTFAKDSSSEPFITTWTVDHRSGYSIEIPTKPKLSYNYDIDWDGDGVYDQTGITRSVSHNYKKSGTYEVRIKGNFPAIFFDNEGSKDKISSVEQWGDIKWETMESAFYGASNLVINASDTPNLKGVTSLDSMFFGANSIGTGNGNWNWDLSNITTLRLTFADTKFNEKAAKEWNTSNVTDMTSTFFKTPFNQNIKKWNTSKVTSMGRMFAYSKFNKNISGWDTSNVRNMYAMFAYNKKFNKDISKWNTKTLDNATYMFAGAKKFDQSLAKWDITSLKYADEMFAKVALSTKNYDSTLKGWSKQKVQSKVKFSAGKSQYSSEGKEAREILVNNGWKITDGGAK